MLSLTHHCYHALPSLLIVFVGMARCFAATDDPTSWTPAEGPAGITYQTVDELRSFYKLADSPRVSRKGAYGLLHDTTSIELGPGPRTLRINGVDITLERPLMRDTAGRLLISRDDWVYWIDPILRPTYIAGRDKIETVIIDASHGGHDKGVACAASQESQVVLQVALALQKELESAGMRCFLTRSGDYFLSDRQRVDQSNALSKAIFVSLHLNQSRAEAKGPAVYIPTPVAHADASQSAHAFTFQSAALAYAVQYMLSAETHLPGTGCHHVHYSLLNSLHMPSVLVCLGYASNPQEAAALTSNAYQARLTAALARGILNYARATSPDATIPVVVAPPPRPKARTRKEPAEPPPAQSKNRSKPRTGRQSRARR